MLAASSSLAGRLSDLTARRGLGGIGCFLGGAVACSLSAAALLLFTACGDLGAQAATDMDGGGLGAAAPAAARTEPAVA